MCWCQVLTLKRRTPLTPWERHISLATPSASSLWNVGKTNTIQDKDSNCLTETNDILERGTEYCVELYSHTVIGDSEVLIVPLVTHTDNYPILREEDKAAVKSLKKGKSTGIDNIPGELVQAGGDTVIGALRNI